MQTSDNEEKGESKADAKDDRSSGFKKKRSDQTFKLIAHADDRDRGRATASEVGGTGSNLLRRINNRHSSDMGHLMLSCPIIQSMIG